ncbi:tRNA pseudouridine(38/39) synthase [Fusarium oxysporum f. sp. albedinis]|nr:tRNA pseudouridine(38/39) synthase [Fusarium oxysporum f. sp. albedinis]
MLICSICLIYRTLQRKHGPSLVGVSYLPRRGLCLRLGHTAPQHLPAVLCSQFCNHVFWSVAQPNASCFPWTSDSLHLLMDGSIRKETGSILDPSMPSSIAPPFLPSNPDCLCTGTNT